MRVKKLVIVDRIGIILAVLTAFWIGLLAFTVHAEAADTGEISAEFPREAVGAGLTLYKVADMQDGNLVFRTPFEGTDFALGDLAQTSRVETVAVQLTEAAAKNDVKGTEVTVDQSGTVRFANLEPALYLLAQTNGLDNIQIQNTLVPLPYTDTDGSSVYNVELKPKYSLPGTGMLNVTKYVTDLAGNPVTAVDAEFYVALFADESRLQRVTDVKTLQFEGASADTVTFRNLRLDIPYYVGETDENGILLESGVLMDASFAPFYPDGDIVKLSTKKPKAEFAFNNAFMELPSGFYYEGELTITKKVLKGKEALETNDVFYAAVFTDKAHTERYTDLIVLDMDGSSEFSVTMPVYAGNSEGDSVTYYVTETDSQGNPLSQGADLGFTFSIDQDKVVVEPGDQSKSVTITNTYTEETETESETGGEETEKPTEKSTEKPTEKSTEKPSEKSTEKSTEKPSKTPVKTGDDTPVMMYLLLAISALALMIAVGTFLYRKSRNTGRTK